MKYRNAQDIFPEDLLKQIQRYVSGETIYIPAGSEKKSWGETSGYQHFIRERNAAKKRTLKLAKQLMTSWKNTVFLMIRLKESFTARRRFLC